MSNMIVFGKYRGESLENVVRNDPNYIIWLKDQKFIDNNFRAKLNRALGTTK